MAVGEGNYGRLGAEQQRRYTDANAETQFSEPATGGTPDEQPGAMPEIFPSYDARRRRVGTPPNIDRCWTCRSMFMQAWGHYGTAWAVVHQQLGVRPHLGHDWLEVVPQVPDGQPRVQGDGHPARPRLGRRARRARRRPLHDGDRHRRRAAADVPDRPHAAARGDGRRRSSSTAAPVDATTTRARPTAALEVCGRRPTRPAPHARRHGGLGGYGAGGAGSAALRALRGDGASRRVRCGAARHGTAPRARRTSTAALREGSRSRAAGASRVAGDRR